MWPKYLPYQILVPVSGTLDDRSRMSYESAMRCNDPKVLVALPCQGELSENSTSRNLSTRAYGYSIMSYVWVRSNSCLVIPCERSTIRESEVVPVPVSCQGQTLSDSFRKTAHSRPSHYMTTSSQRARIVLLEANCDPYDQILAARA